MPRKSKSPVSTANLKRSSEVVYPKPTSITYHYGVWQPKFDEILESNFSIKFVNGLPIELENKSNDHQLIVIDDLLNESSKSDDLLNLFCRGSHHNNISVIFITQNFFHKNLRPLTLNSKYLICMRNLRDCSWVNNLGKQLNHGRKYHLLESAYGECLKIPFSYFFIDLSNEQENSDCRIRCGFFPENCVVYMCKNKQL